MSLIIADLAHGDLDAAFSIRALAARSPGCQIIVIGSTEHAGIADRLVGLHVHGFFTRPIDFGALVARVSLLSRLADDNSPDAGALALSRCSTHVLAYFSAHYAESFSLATLARAVGVSPGTLARVFLHDTKRSPRSFRCSFAATVNPLFTCFGSSNLGLPLNPRDAFFYQTTPDFFGFTANPLGFGYRDLGLGTFLRSGFGSAPNPDATLIPFAPSVDGQMQVSTARNVAMTPPGCTTEAPGPFFQKGFFHNGYAKSLKQLVHFYNTRDVFPFAVTSGNCPTGTTEKVDCWPMPEVPNNMDMTVGNLGLTDLEENQIVAFLQTLTDGFTTPYPNINTFTGTCTTGTPGSANASASTQGNDSLIPTPPLPPCASAVCGVAPVPSPPIRN